MAKYFLSPSQLRLPTSFLEPSRNSQGLLKLPSICPSGYLGLKKGGHSRVICACSVPSARNRYQDSPALIIDHQDATQLEEPTVSKTFEDDTEVLIECRNIHKSFGEKHILRGVSFKIRYGEAVGIIGPSGTGKSTILKIMAGLLAPDKGKSIFVGKSEMV